MKIKTYVDNFLPYIFLTALMLFILTATMEPGEFFGSEGDWYSQHVGAADNLRQMMLDTGRLIPQFSAAGGGSNIYDFAYYGLLRPDILISALAPAVPMKYFIAGYALLSAVSAVNLCFYWLSAKEGQSRFAAAAASVMRASSTAFYHAHHQIMFINYMPFLILALMGIDRLTEKKGSGLLIFSLFLIYLHSYFYAFSCLAVCLLYYLHKMQDHKADFIAITGKAAASVLLSIGLAAVLLLPTVLDILSTHKDSGKFSTESVALIEPFKGLLYNPYGCGMTLVTLACLIFALKYKKNRFAAAAVLIAVSVPSIWLLLNGFLYPREKILIPFIPLIVYLCGDTLDKICSNSGRRKAAICLLLIIPICTSLQVHKSEKFMQAKDERQSHFSKADINMFAGDRRYRFDYLANSFVTSNLVIDSSLYKTAMYSSVTNDLYADFYYNTMRNPISLRNRVVLMPNQNPYFNYFMGIRYILAKANTIPAGYEVVFKRDGYALAENKNTLPICYGTNQILSAKDFRKLKFPDTLEALSTRVVAEANTTTEFHSHIQRASKPPASPDEISIMEFLVDNPTGDEITIDIAGIRNVLSGKSAPYPNENHRFTYIAQAPFTEMKTKGEFDINYRRYWTMNKKYLKHEDITVPVCDADRKPDGKTMFKGEIDMEKDGYFVTSFPYKKGYQVTVDNQRIKPETVNTAFLGFPITKGHHDIQIEYTAPGFVLGRAVSLIFAALTALWMFLQNSEAFRYVITGGMTTAVNYLIFFLLTMGKMNYLAANSIAWAGAVLFAYFANRHVVFHSTGSQIREFCSFCGMRAATLVIENLLLYLFIDGIGTAETPAKIAVSVITVVLNYAACKYSIFNTKIKEGGNSHE